jgi:methylglutaconyl-CoA hydratase
MEKIKLSVDPPAATITLNRPEVRNALSPDLVESFSSALEEVRRRHDVAAVIVTGQGKAFCAGADLDVLREMTNQSAEEARQDSLGLMNLYRGIYEFPKPVIAAVNGPAIAGGCGLASVCDLVLSVEDAIFGYSEAKIGFIPALVSVFLVRICGEKKARELLLTGRTFSAAEAKEIGLVNHIVPAKLLLAKARELVETISKNSPIALTLTKELIRDLHGLNLNQGLEAALQLNTLIRTTEDFKEGVSSFFERREPEWKRR